MIQIDLPTLVKRLNLFSRQALEMAASECMSQQAAEITVSHVLIQMLAMPRSDLRVITRQGDIGMEELRQALTVENYTTARSADSYPAFSPMLVEWLKEGWLLASAEMQHSELRGGVLLLALLHSPLRYIPPAAARLLTGINRDRLQQDFVQWTQESAESVVPDADGKGAGTMTDASDTLLARYAKNMTADARNGRLDPVLCRDHEIDLMIDILCRRRKNNPVVVGEAGVGKSALIEGLALRIVAGQVPDKLKNTDIMTLDLGALQAGASVKGEFEKRFKGLMAEVISSPVPVILFIDEAHTLIGAGNQQGGLDISNLLKPALARGELKTIAATTWSEYKKYFEKDAALSRRFQLVKVSEPNAAEATIILRGLSAVYEQSHGVLIDDDALQAAATLSERYLSGRQLPDKAIDVLDTACARVAINLSSPPKQISALTTLSHQQEAEIRQLERELRIGLRTDTSRMPATAAPAEASSMAGVAVAVATTTPPDATATLQAMQSCRRESAALERLDCYDRLLAPLSPSGFDGALVKAGFVGEAWTRATEQEKHRQGNTTELLVTQVPGERPTVVITTPAIGHVPPRPVLMFSCVDNITRMQVALMHPLDVHDIAVTLNADNRALRSHWFVRENGTLLESSRGLSGIDEIKQLFGAKTLTVDTGADNAAGKLTFNIDGLARAIAPLRDACHWAGE
ncbi:type VI secretion system-associated protein TagO [Escherichia coli]|nr:type VI secretion system-associated protein TagO [Escherichia coli]